MSPLNRVLSGALAADVLAIAAATWASYQFLPAPDALPVSLICAALASANAIAAVILAIVMRPIPEAQARQRLYDAEDRLYDVLRHGGG